MKKVSKYSRKDLNASKTGKINGIEMTRNQVIKSFSPKNRCKAKSTQERKKNG